MASTVTTKKIAGLPQIKREVWEVGRRSLEVSVPELQRKGDRPEVLLAVQSRDPGGVVFFEIVPSTMPPTALVEFALRAMASPLLGDPRRPQAIRVASQTDAEVLAEALTAVGVWLDVSSALPALDAVYRQMNSMLGGVRGDYRTQATQTGDSLSEDGLREFFLAARRFYARELWFELGDEVVFEIELQRAGSPPKTLHGIVLGSLGEEFGLVLYDSLQDLGRFYEVSLGHEDQLLQFPQRGRTQRGDPDQRRAQGELVAKLLSIPSLALTYTPQQDAPAALMEEARQLKLPIAKKSAFPLLLRTGGGRLQVGNANDLRDMLRALHALLDWDTQIGDMDVVDEVGVTITSRFPAVADFVPDTIVRTTLRDNPHAPEDDEPLLPVDRKADLSALLTPVPTRKTQPRPKPPKATPGTRQKASRQKAGARPGAPAAARIYTLRVYLVGGPIPEEYEGQVVSRTIQILGRQTLHDLHRAIFQAFDRFEEHLYEFNLGKGTVDRSKLYESGEPRETKAQQKRDPETTTLDALRLSVGRRFGYLFDMGDNWEHIIEVAARVDGPGRGTYPRVTDRVGASPPQYPDEDEEEDE
jgi:hypothetical protein